MKMKFQRKKGLIQILKNDANENVRKYFSDTSITYIFGNCFGTWSVNGFLNFYFYKGGNMQRVLLYKLNIFMQ